MVEIVVFPAVQVLDVTGPLQVFASANVFSAETGAAQPPYVVRVVARSQLVVCSAGLGLVAEILPLASEPIDTLVVAGGEGVDAAAADPTLVTWVQGRAARARRTTSVCTGAFILASAGLLDGRCVATHWSRCAELARRYPAVQVEADPIFIQDGSTWTSAGVTAGIDLALALVEQDIGRAMAMRIARDLVVFFKRPGGQAQFSAAMMLQDTGSAFSALHDWIGENLDRSLPLSVLARQAGMSERSFSRRYLNATGRTPARAVEHLRVEAARHLLSDTELPIKVVAQRCGFGSEEIMRRCFHRLLATSPQDYRIRFGK